MKRIIPILVAILLAHLVLYAAPIRNKGLSVYLAPKSAPEIFGVDKGGFVAVILDKKQNQLREKLVFVKPEQLVEFFLKQPQEMQKNGLWIVTTNPKSYSDEEMESTEILKKMCREKNIVLFFCRGMWLPNGWLPSDKFNLKNSDSIYENILKSKKIENEAIKYMQQGNYNAAIKLLDEALKITLNPGYVIHDRGMVYLNKGEFDKAIIDFTKAIEMNPNEKKFIAQCYNDRGVAYFLSGQYEKSWQDVQKAVSLGYNVNPEFIAALKNEGYSE